MKIKYFKMQVARDFFNASNTGNEYRIYVVTPLYVEKFGSRNTIKMTYF